MANVIEIRNLVRRFGAQTVLDGINLDIAEGETMVIMGGSGCGKSTLLRHLIGSLQPSEGSIKIFGEEIATVGEAGLDSVRKKFGILFQSGALFNSMSIADNIALPLREHANKFPSQISGGMKKRAGLARALALDPRILFYDEPSAGLDPVTSAEIDQLMLDLTRKLGVTSVVVTHEMDSAFTIADRMTMLDKGRALMIDTRAAFDALRKTSLEDCAKLQEKDRLIRQFLRGDAQGPLTERKAATNYAEDLLSLGAEKK